MIKTLFRIVLFSGLATLLPALAADIPCATCHADYTSGAVHAATETPCQACHGDGAEHASNPSTGITRFGDGPVGERIAACTGCHTDVHAVGRSAHEQAGLACDNCHSVHAKDAQTQSRNTRPPGFDALDDASATCYGCHEETFAEFSGVERHRLQKGAVSCTSCHDPHATVSQSSLGGFQDAKCAECHAAQGGPFVFEHAASRVDGCIACHSPHGNPNRFLLAHQQVGELCYSCHATVPQFHLGFAPTGSPRFGLDSVCTNCHATIHGSNFDRNFLK